MALVEEVKDTQKKSDKVRQVKSNFDMEGNQKIMDR